MKFNLLPPADHEQNAIDSTGEGISIIGGWRLGSETYVREVSFRQIGVDEEIRSATDVAKKHGYANRSEAVRDVLRESLVRDARAGKDEIVGTITIVYDHHKRELTDQLTKIQHEHHDAVLATTHIHLDHDNCMEMIAVKGTASTVQKLADALIGARGAMHGKLSATTTGKKLK